MMGYFSTPNRWLLLLFFLFLTFPKNSFALTPDQLYEKVKDTVIVVKIYDEKNRLIGTGSGVMLPSGNFITNYHVIKRGAHFRVFQGEKSSSAKLISMDAKKDICIISAPGMNAKPASLGQATNLRVGERVYAVGAPKGLELSLSEGIVSQLRGGPPPIIQTTAAISPGSSGGGLFNSEGELVGITTLQMEDGQNLNFALPVEWVIAINNGKTDQFPGAGIPERERNILYSKVGPIHLGDEEFSDWPPLHGTCLEMEINVKHPVQDITLIIQTYGLEITAPIYLNNNKITVLPPQTITQRGNTRPNYWSKDQFINIQSDKLINGFNKLTICTDLVAKPEFPGDKDDFQIRNVRVVSK